MSRQKLPDGQAAANKRAYDNKWRAENRQRVRDLEKARRIANPDQFKATKKRHYEKNKVKCLEYAAAYREANAELIKQKCSGKYAEWSAKYRKNNYQKCLEMTQAWKDANPERRKAMCAQWSQNNLDKHRTYQHNRRARKKAGGGTLSPDLAKKLLVLQKGLCACCKEPLGENYEMDHIFPLALGGSNNDENIQLLTARCNRQKGAKHPVEFMQIKRGMLL